MSETEWRPYTHAEIREEAIDDLAVDPAIFLLLDKLSNDQRASVFGAYCRCGSEDTACRCRYGDGRTAS